MAKKENDAEDYSHILDRFLTTLSPAQEVVAASIKTTPLFHLPIY
ncbi:MAG: hypothetical protein ACTXOO_00145 [Sodalis sp. (in: enterobacteria)]